MKAEASERRHGGSQPRTPGGTRRCPLRCSPRSFPQVSSSPEHPSPPPGRQGLEPAALGAPGLRGSGTVLRSAPPPQPRARPANCAAHRAPSVHRASSPVHPRLAGVLSLRDVPHSPSPHPGPAEPRGVSARSLPRGPEVRAAPQPRSANAGCARSPAPAASPQPK